MRDVAGFRDRERGTVCVQCELVRRIDCCQSNVIEKCAIPRVEILMLGALRTLDLVQQKFQSRQYICKQKLSSKVSQGVS